MTRGRIKSWKQQVGSNFPKRDTLELRELFSWALRFEQSKNTKEMRQGKYESGRWKW